MTGMLTLTSSRARRLSSSAMAARAGRTR
jgi:hypothetical protein